MQTVMGIENFPGLSGAVYLALGNFDGVHKGHQSLIRALVEKAAANGGQAVAFIFEPHPAQVLMPERAPSLLNTPGRKAQLLAQMGLDFLIYHPFTREIAGWSPRDFVDKILIQGLHCREVFVGFNYTFGHRGAGTPQLLQQMGDELGFAVNIIAPVEFAGEPISSSQVRRALEEGDINTARQLLGYYPVLEGVVVEGEHRGAQLGFPTANIGVESIYNVPGKGVYAARAEVGTSVYQCVVNIGSKPTFHEQYPLSIEAHLMNFSGDIYGQAISLSFLAKLRDERRFDSLPELIAQITRDRDRALEISRDSQGDL
ncbi:MAG: bifunctional riboflavin kinase/FAD synthetase [Firmicutes bacterium]|nr:bifunctional riboflavin kinase/FAD synthetase [Bacillota bacterium]